MTYRCLVLRYAMSPRWVLWHVFCICAIGFLITAGVWQWDVAINAVNDAGEPEVSVRNLVYAIQWWVFAAFGVWFWWRYLRDQRDAELAELQSEVTNAPDQQIVAIHTTSNEADKPISLEGSAAERRRRAQMLRDPESGSPNGEGSTDK